MKSMLQRSKLLLFFCLLFHAATAQNLFVNGNFESNTPAPNQLNCNLAPYGWTASVTTPPTSSMSGMQWENRWNSSWWIDLTDCSYGNGRWLEQTVNLTIGQQYLLSFDLGSGIYTDCGVDLYIDNVFIRNFNQPAMWNPTNALNWKTFSWCFTAETDYTSIKFVCAAASGTGPAMGFDNAILEVWSGDIELQASSLCAPALLSYTPAITGDITWYKDSVVIDTQNASVNAVTPGLYTLVLITPCDTFVKDTLIIDCDTCQPVLDFYTDCELGETFFSFEFPVGCCASNYITVDFGDGQDPVTLYPPFDFSNAYPGAGSYDVTICWESCDEGGKLICMDSTVMVGEECCLPALDFYTDCEIGETFFSFEFAEGCCAGNYIIVDFGDGQDPVTLYPPFDFSNVYPGAGSYDLTICWEACDESGDTICIDTTVVIGEGCCPPLFLAAEYCTGQPTYFNFAPMEECCYNDFSIDYGDGSPVDHCPTACTFAHTYTAPGLYNVQYCWTDCNGQRFCLTVALLINNCGTPSDKQGENPGEKAEEAITMYPNPSRGNITIAGIPLQQGQIRVNVYDAYGRLYTSTKVRKGDTRLQMDLSTYAAGVYLIKVEGADFSKDLILTKE